VERVVLNALAMIAAKAPHFSSAFGDSMASPSEKSIHLIDSRAA